MREVRARLMPGREEVNAATPVAGPAFYYDLLAPRATAVDIWRTTYEHVMPDAAAIVEWVKGTGLRPYLDDLTEPSARPTSPRTRPPSSLPIRRGSTASACSRFRGCSSWRFARQRYGPPRAAGAASPRSREGGRQRRCGAARRRSRQAGSGLAESRGTTRSNLSRIASGMNRVRGVKTCRSPKRLCCRMKKRRG